MNTTSRTATERWTQEHDEILRERFHSEYVQDIADDLGFSRSTVNAHARRLGLRKENPKQRNKDVREFVRMEFENLTYREMAERTGLNDYTIFKMASEMGLSRTKDKWKEHISRGRKKVYKKERRRVIFGMDQKTRLKVVSNKKKHRLRHKLRKHGYIIAKGDNTVYYTDSLERHPIRERNGEKLGLKFKPLPSVLSPEETGENQHLRPCGAVD